MLGMRHTIDSTSIRRSEPFEGGTFSRFPIIYEDFRHNARFYCHFFDTCMNEWSSKIVRFKAFTSESSLNSGVNCHSERNTGAVQVSESLRRSLQILFIVLLGQMKNYTNHHHS